MRNNRAPTASLGRRLSAEHGPKGRGHPCPVSASQAYGHPAQYETVCDEQAQLVHGRPATVTAERVA